MDEREARIRHLLAWARTYHTSVNGIDQAAYDVEQVLAALAAAERERDEATGQRDRIISAWAHSGADWRIQPSAMFGEREWQVIQRSGRYARYPTLDEAIAAAGLPASEGGGE